MNNEISSLTQKIEIEFDKLKDYILETYGLTKKTRNIIRLNNLYNGLKYAIDNRKRNYFLVPAKILGPKVIDKKGNIIYKTKSELDRMIHKDSKSYYNTEGKDSDFIFSIDELHGERKYRLNFLFNNEDIDAFIRRIHKSRQLPKESTQSAAEIERILQEYLKRVEIDSRYLPVEHMGVISPVPIMIDDNYVPLRATRDESLTEASYLSESLKSSSDIGDNYTKENRIVLSPPSQAPPIKQIIQSVVKSTQPFQNCMAFLGASGSGKSTFLRYLVHSIASGKGKDWGLERFIPIFISLPRYSESNESDLIDYCLNSTVEGEGNKNDFRSYIKQSSKSAPGDGHGAIFLLDALDEVRGKKEEIIKEIELKASEYQNAIFIVTARIAGYYKAPLNNFYRYKIVDIAPEEIPIFIESWFSILAKSKAMQEPEKDWDVWARSNADTLNRKLYRKPSLRSILTTPLYLSFLVLSASIPYTHLPETKSELFDYYFNTLLLNWEEKNGLPYSPGLLLEGFHEICWRIHETQFGDTCHVSSLDYLRNCIAGTIAADVDQLFSFWIKAGIFVRVLREDQIEIIIQRHLSFLEYGFGCKLASLWHNPTKKEGLWEDLRENLNNEDLLEPLMIFIGKINSPISFLERVQNLRDDLFHSNLTFLGCCANELQTKLRGEGLVKEVIDSCKRLWCSKNLDHYDIWKELLAIIGALEGMAGLSKLWEQEADEDRKIDIADIMLRFGDRTIINALEELARNHWDYYLQIRAGKLIALYDSRKALSVLREVLDRGKAFLDGDELGRRAEIIHAICELRGNLDVMEIRELYQREKELASKISLAECIGKWGDAQLALFLLNELYSGACEAFYKMRIAIAAARLDYKYGAELIIQILRGKHSRENQRRFLARLRENKVAVGTAFLRELLGRESKKEVQVEIGLLMALNGDAEIKPMLIEFLGEKIFPSQKKNVALYLARYGDKDDGRFLEKILTKEKNLGLRWYYYHAISKLSGGSAIPFFIKRLNMEKDYYTRLAIAISVFELGDKERGLAIIRDYCKNAGKWGSSGMNILRMINRVTGLLAFQTDTGGIDFRENPRKYSFKRMGRD